MSKFKLQKEIQETLNISEGDLIDTTTVGDITKRLNAVFALN
ncbi:MAG: hypothetical protein ACOYOK_06665 [Pseudobdellovibrionaceae bacterium]